MTLPSSHGLEEDKGVLKSGNVVAAFSPTKSKKSYYAVVSDRALELHDSEKTYRKKKAARHLMDLSVAFNVHNDHLDPKLKYCVCLMGPDETLCLKAENRQQNAEWHDAILRAIVLARAYKLCRPVQLSEFFEFAWDVDIVVAPKLRKPLSSNEQLPSMCDQDVGLKPGRTRLCFYPHTIILCKRKIEPATNDLPPGGIPPFSTSHFIELPRMYMAFYGSQERYFLIRMGRSSPSGACELWIQCESEQVANEVHVKLNFIIERESEKKKKMNGGNAPFPTLRTHHRERSHAQPIHMRTNSNGQTRRSPAQSTSMIGRKPSTFRAGRASNSASIKEELSSDVYVAMTVASPVPKAVRSPSTLPLPSTKTPTTASSETEDRLEWALTSGGTLRLNNGSFREGNGSTRSSQRSPIIAEAVIEHRSKDTYSSDHDELSSAGGVNGLSSGADIPEEETSYTPMEAAQPSLGSSTWLAVPTQFERDRYNLEEVRSYVSDSSDSCHSSMAANSSVQGNPPRAHSFGGHGNIKPAVLSVAMPPIDSVTALNGRENVACPVLPQDDPRKRAFSLGSKSFFQRPFRKIFTHTNRQQRHSQTSASGASLASSAGSSFGPSSSSTNRLATVATDKEDCSRNRSDSFGSGRSTPYTCRGGAGSAGGVTPNDHHVEMDFSGLGRSGSGSVASVASLSRSRTSSFGCAVRKDDFFFSVDQESDAMKPSQKVLQQMQHNSVEDSADYVITGAAGEDPLAIQKAIQEESAAFLSSFEPFKKIRCSQVIETIQENTSERSTRSSSQTSSDPAGAEEYTPMDCTPSTSATTETDISSLPTRPERSASCPVTEALAPPTALPKRSSVPSMSTHDDVEDTTLNYACLQIHDDSQKPFSLPKDSLLSTSSPSTHARSKSGILFSKDSSQQALLDYATIRPL